MMGQCAEDEHCVDNLPDGLAMDMGTQFKCTELLYILKRSTGKVCIIIW